jgi:hypothetical protein
MRPAGLFRNCEKPDRLKVSSNLAIANLLLDQSKG